jgi:hypothetical protein
MLFIINSMAEDQATIQSKQAVIKGKGVPNLAVQYQPL